MAKHKDTSEKTDTKELLELEKRYWQALQDRDGSTAARLSDEPSILAGAQGVSSLDRKTIASMFDSFESELQSYELKSPQVRFLTRDVAVVAYTVHEELIVEGKPVALDAADSSTWIRRDGSWCCAVHSESLLGDPFGRDRKPADA
jgi:uncharacterized protein (TIGR02246 family)